MRHIFRPALLCALVVLALLPHELAALGAADSADPPASPTAREVMENIIRDVLGILRDPKLSQDDKSQKIHAIAYDNINFVVMARLCLGRPWRDITDAQRAQYVQEFRQHVANTYGHSTDDYTDEDVNVVGDHPESDGDWTVQTSIIGNENGGPRKEVAKVDYRLRKQNDRWLVIDFSIDGVSLVSNFRSQFQEIMSDGGIDQLIKLLHDKNASTQK
jgi:phospholipid transport system substrate-binding protein